MHEYVLVDTKQSDVGDSILGVFKTMEAALASVGLTVYDELEPHGLAIVMPDHPALRRNMRRNPSDKVYAVHFNTIAYQDMDGSDEHYVVDSIYTTKEKAEKRLADIEQLLFEDYGVDIEKFPPDLDEESLSEKEYEDFEAYEDEWSSARATFEGRDYRIIEIDLDPALKYSEGLQFDGSMHFKREGEFYREI